MFANTESIITLLSTALTPAFLLVALGSLLNLYTGRLARIVDRSRDLQNRFDESTGMEHELVVLELRDHDKRIQIVNLSIFHSVLSGIVVSILIGMLFIGGLFQIDLGTQIAIAFLIAMIFLIASLIMFLREVRFAIRNLHIREQFLRLPEDERAHKKDR
ncbi:hypothetical protein LPB140_03875 [Sphingorhabdus lutea]|uniref:DUF2721 domain-containing protein n=1 Tax=Sphingorhabdus lutea TaxID=1913578 RepID=A0A1L3JEJ2_9SPHN|nr:DUF2721 domain-containing protein [Sphingorhabdus lutea]APG63550.1 hypothetical protein LPB140_03875 [Sphingorhabdus lutea]